MFNQYSTENGLKHNAKELHHMGMVLRNAINVMKCHILDGMTGIAETAAQQWMVNRMNEYIDKQAAMDCMMDCQHDFRDGCVWIPRHEAVTRLEKMQPADVQPVIHARWEIGTGFRWRCSVCGGLTYIPSKFCFNCGARMDGEKDG